MTDEIYLIGQDDKLVEMRAQDYDSESLLQHLLAEYPNLLAGNQIDSSAPRRWLLVRREMGVPSDEDGGNRWAVDHLFLDQDGVPTLVEVKRGTDSRIRREVVGQMLDYAANAVVYWPVEEIRSRFEARCNAGNVDADDEIAQILGDEIDPDAFWAKVKTNLQAGKVRMLFVADVVPPELRRVVEFLNTQMDPAEVLAFEIKQYVGEGLRTLVPRVIGQTAKALPPKTSRTGERQQWDKASFFKRLGDECGDKAVKIAEELLEWADGNTSRVWWGRGKRDGSFGGTVSEAGTEHSLFAVYTYGRVEIYFQHLKENPPFSDETKRKDLLARLNRISGIDLPEDSISRRPTISLSDLAHGDTLDELCSVFEWVINEIRADDPAR